MDYINAFKQYVPAEIIAAFIAINSIVPYRADIDFWIVVGSIAVLVIFFIVSSLVTARFKSNWVMIVVAVTLPFWCVIVAFDRLNNVYPIEEVRVVFSVGLIIVSLGLTLFAHDQARPA